jgi:hypothetical protein
MGGGFEGLDIDDLHFCLVSLYISSRIVYAKYSTLYNIPWKARMNGLVRSNFDWILNIDKSSPFRLLFPDLPLLSNHGDVASRLTVDRLIACLNRKRKKKVTAMITRTAVLTA